VYRLGDGEVIAEGFNRKELASDATGHAEIAAIRAAGVKLGDWRLEGCGLAVTLEPCCMCAGAIVHARLAKLVYATSDPKAGFCQSLGALTSDARLNHRVMPLCAEVFEPALAREASEQLRGFFRSRRG
jgi:tRNA(adenine34) deaminase